MDYQEEFEKTAVDTAACLLRRGSTGQRWSLDDGTSVKGWTIASDNYREEILPTKGSSYWKEAWGTSAKILATDGTFWEYRVSYLQSSNLGSQTQKTESLRKIPPSSFVGSQGKPFSRWKAELERLPYKQV